MASGMSCPKCGAPARCITERGWHGHRCLRCHHVQVFTKGSGRIPTDLLAKEATT